MLRISIFVTLLSICWTAQSAPIPGAGSSQIPKLLRNIVISEHGFKVGTSQSNFWTLKQNANSSDSNTFQYIAGNPQLKAQFTINVDKLSKPTSFDAYISKSVKEYPYFGFQILKTQVMKLGGQPCYLMDLAHTKRNRQMRQFVIVKKDIAVIMTCVDEIGRFKETAMHCADLINNFQWTSSTLSL